MPDIGQMSAFVEWSDRAFPVIHIIKSVTVCKASTGETDKTGLKISYKLCKVTTKPVFTPFECILWEKRNHVECISTCLQRHYFESGISIISSSNKCTCLLFPIFCIETDFVLGYDISVFRYYSYFCKFFLCARMNRRYEKREVIFFSFFHIYAVES